MRLTSVCRRAGWRNREWKKREDRVSVRCGAVQYDAVVVAKNQSINQTQQHAHILQYTYYCTSATTPYTVSGPTPLFFFSIFHWFSFLHLTIVVGRKGLCVTNKHTYIRYLSPYLYYFISSAHTLSTFTLSLSLSRRRRLWRDGGGVSFCLFLS